MNEYNLFFQKVVDDTENAKRAASFVEMFIFSKEFVNYPMRKDIVIVRPRVDNYLLNFTLANGGSLVNGRYSCRCGELCSTVVRTIHLGWTTYKDRVWNKKKEDINWNVDRYQISPITIGTSDYGLCTERRVL